MRKENIRGSVKIHKHKFNDQLVLLALGLQAIDVSNLILTIRYEAIYRSFDITLKNLYNNSLFSSHQVTPFGWDLPVAAPSAFEEYLGIEFYRLRISL